MGARKFPLTILSTKKVRSMVGIWGQKNKKNKPDFEKNSSIISANEKKKIVGLIFLGEGAGTC